MLIFCTALMESPRLALQVVMEVLPLKLDCYRSLATITASFDEQQLLCSAFFSVRETKSLLATLSPSI